MTIFNFIKFVIILMLLMGFVFIGAGAWKIRSAYRFSQNAEKTSGTFVGYQEVQQDSRIENASGFKIKVTEKHALFKYTDAQGRTRTITGPDVVVFESLKSGDPVDILVSPHDPENARLADPYYLYGGGGYLCLGGLAAIFVLFTAYKTIPLIGVLQGIGRMRLPLGDLIIVGGGFIVLAGALMGFGTWLIMKRQDPALIQAMEAGRFDEARTLALQGRGIEGKNAAGEPALIVALQKNRPEVARAILDNPLVSTHVVAADGTSGLALAASRGDHNTLAMMLDRGAETFGLDPFVVHGLIKRGDPETLAVIVSSSFDLNAEFAGLTFGDHAVMSGRVDMVRLMQDQVAHFEAPRSFIALVFDDADALALEMKKPDACTKKFNRLTLSQFAEKIGKTQVLASAGGCNEATGRTPVFR